MQWRLIRKVKTRRALGWCYLIEVWSHLINGVSRLTSFLYIIIVTKKIWKGGVGRILVDIYQNRGNIQSCKKKGEKCGSWIIIWNNGRVIEYSFALVVTIVIFSRLEIWIYAWKLNYRSDLFIGKPRRKIFICFLLTRRKSMIGSLK